MSLLRPSSSSGSSGSRSSSRERSSSSREARDAKPGKGAKSEARNPSPNNENTDWSALATEDGSAKDKKAPPKPLLSVNLFWRSFGLMALLLALVVPMWQLSIDRLEAPARAALVGQQLASLVNISRTALMQTEGQRRAAVFRTLEDQEGLQLRQRTGSEQWVSAESDAYRQAVGASLRALLGTDTILAETVNGNRGVWIGFSIGTGQFWLRGDESRLSSAAPLGWWWPTLLAVITAGLTALFVRFINRPLKDLSFAASRIGEGEYNSHLDESNITNEIRMVNMGFNRMARELAKVEEERAVMLAGISHDLRTPLARLRLEAEISVVDEEARRNMADDIDQLDAIIDKFMDYARPDGTRVVPVNLTAVVEREASLFRDKSQIRIESRLPPNVMVKGDDTELGRVFANLFENARRYGRSEDTGIARVKVSHVQAGDSYIITVRDYGQGVAPEKLAHLTTPFFRGDAARTAATGAGLGLAVVKKALQRIDGSLELTNATEKTGLVAHLRLKKALLPTGVGGSTVTGV